VFRSVEIAQPRTLVALDPDQILDDLVNRIKRCGSALGDDAMRWTISSFQHCIWFCVVLLSFPPIEAFSRRTKPSLSRRSEFFAMHRIAFGLDHFAFGDLPTVP